MYVTHDQTEAITLADRVMMDGGYIKQIGTPEEIYSDRESIFVAGFIGSPPMKLIKGQVSAGSVSALGIKVDGIEIEGSRNAIIGIRPEDLNVDARTGNLQGEVYCVEPTGDTTFLTVKTDDALIEVKVGRVRPKQDLFL